MERKNLLLVRRNLEPKTEIGSAGASRQVLFTFYKQLKVAFYPFLIIVLANFKVHMSE